MLAALVLFQELCVDYCVDELRYPISSPISSQSVERSCPMLETSDTALLASYMQQLNPAALGEGR